MSKRAATGSEMRSGRIEHYLRQTLLRRIWRVLTANISMKGFCVFPNALDHTLASFTDLTDRIRAEQERLS